MTNNSHSGPKKKNFLWIKQNLDSSLSYIIFENDIKKQGESIFDPDHMAYAFLKGEKHTWQQVIDMDLSREYLVIQIQPGNEDEVLGRLMGYGFPRDTVYYLYKAEET